MKIIITIIIIMYFTTKELELIKCLNRNFLCLVDDFEFLIKINV